jgi:hypothetical protein
MSSPNQQTQVTLGPRPIKITLESCTFNNINYISLDISCILSSDSYPSQNTSP